MLKVRVDIGLWNQNLWNGFQLPLSLEPGDYQSRYADMLNVDHCILADHVKGYLCSFSWMPFPSWVIKQGFIITSSLTGCTIIIRQQSFLNRRDQSKTWLSDWILECYKIPSFQATFHFDLQHCVPVQLTLAFQGPPSFSLCSGVSRTITQPPPNTQGTYSQRP